MKWYTSSLSVAARASPGTIGCGGEKLLCARRMASLLPIARPAALARLPQVPLRHHTGAKGLYILGVVLPTTDLAVTAG